MLLVFCIIKLIRAEGRIISGEGASNDTAPYMVALFNEAGDFQCGGSIISTRVILTAAHCIEGLYEIAAGLRDLTKKNESQVRRIQDYRVHELYAITDTADIALLLLEEPLIFNDKVKPIDLAHTFISDSVKYGRVFGWGATKQTANESTYPTKLQTTIIPIQKMINCRSITIVVEQYGNVKRNMICGGPRSIISSVAPDLYSNVCSGDSGSPLVHRSLFNDKIKQIGIVSMTGAPICNKITPSLFTKVSTFYDWIKKNELEILSFNDGL